MKFNVTILFFSSKYFGYYYVCFCFCFYFATWNECLSNTSVIKKRNNTNKHNQKVKKSSKKKPKNQNQLNQLTCTHKCEISWTLAPLSNRPIARVSSLHARTIARKTAAILNNLKKMALKYLTGVYFELAPFINFCWRCCCCFTVSNELDFISFLMLRLLLCRLPYRTLSTMCQKETFEERVRCTCMCVDEAREHEPNA